MAASRKSRSTSSDAPLVCPSCGTEHGADERFCLRCGMPLVHSGAGEPVSATREHARKIDPRYAQGEPVKVAFTRNEAESDLIQSMLLEEGIPSIARRSRGFDVPDFLAAGPRDILVPESGVELARELLEEVPFAETVVAQPSVASSARIVVAVLGGGLIAALLAWLLVQASG